jgi:hypothetical protein
LGGRTKKDGSNSGRGASPNVNIDEFGEKETFWWSFFCTLKRNETPDEGPTWFKVSLIRRVQCFAESGIFGDFF